MRGDADLPELAGEFGAGGGNKMLHTLEIRESRSSLAGAFMAAASEGTGAVDHLRRMHESSNLQGDAHRVVHKALTSPKLQAVDPNAIQPHGGIVDQLSDMSGGGTPAPLPVASPDDVAPLLDSPQLSLSPEALRGPGARRRGYPARVRARGSDAEPPAPDRDDPDHRRRRR